MCLSGSAVAASTVHEPASSHIAAGFTKTIKQLDGRDIVVTYNGVTQPFEVRRIAGEGMPNHNVPSQRGTLFVKYIVALPKSLSSAQQAAISSNF